MQEKSCRVACAIGIAIVFNTGVRAQTISHKHSARAAQLEIFNASFNDATRRMDDAALMGLWDDDGVALLPNTPALIGKKKIAALLDQVVADHPASRMDEFKMDCFDVGISGS